MVLDIIGFILVSPHILTVGIIILWFGVGKPRTAAKFRSAFKQHILGVKNHGTELHSKP